MIHTVTPNPVIDLIYLVPRYEKGQTVRAGAFQQLPAGKGLSVSYALSCLGTPSVAHLLLGEDEVPLYTRACGEKRIEPAITAGPFETRKHCTILEEETRGVTHIQTRGRPVPAELPRRLLEGVRAKLQPGDLAAVSGSAPEGMPPDFFRELLEAVKTAGARALFDSSGEPLREGVKAAPAALKANQTEAEELLGGGPLAPEDAPDACRAIRREYGIEHVAISLGGEGIAAADASGAWRLRVPIPKEEVVDTVGCGDTTLAGMARALQGGMTGEAMYRYAIACASAATQQPGPGLLDPADVEKFLARVECERVG